MGGVILDPSGLKVESPLMGGLEITHWTPDDEPSLAAWYRADRLVFEDVAGTNPAEDADLIARWNTLAGGDDLTQAVAGSRPTLDTLDALIGDRATANIVPPRFLAGTSLSNYNYLHDGTGGLWYVVFHTNAAAIASTLIATSNGTALLDPGIQFQWDGGSSRILWIGRKTTAGASVVATTAVGSVPLNSSHWVAASLDASAGVNAVRVWLDGVLVVDQAVNNAPLIENAAQPIHIGREQDGGAPANLDIAEIGTFARAGMSAFAGTLVPGDLARYISRRYGI